MEEYQFPTTRLLSQIDGFAITTYKGKPVLVKSYISGQVIQDLDETQLTQVGAAMARLHEFPTLDFLSKVHDYGLETFPRGIGHDIDPAYENWLSQQYDYLKKEIPPNLPSGLIHGDVFYDNVLFDKGQFKAIIDFEEACHYYYVFDLGMGIVGLCTDGIQVNLHKIQTLISGYQQVRQLLLQEKDILQIMAAYAAAATSSWRFWKYNIDTPIPEKAALHREMMQISESIHEIPEDEFLKG